MSQPNLKFSHRGFQLSTWCNKLVQHSFFTGTILVLILINAIMIGLETYPAVYDSHQGIFYVVDKIILWLFTLEIILKLIASKPTFHYFKDGWNLFDFVIVVSGHLFASSQFVTVLRILRVIRIFRTVSIFPSLRKMVNALLNTLPSLGTIFMLLIILFYIFSVIGTMLYKNVAPEYFGTLQHSALTLFQMVTLESWASGVMRPVMEQVPWSWIYFVSFILIGTFVVMNLFVGVIVNNFERADAEEQEEDQTNEQLKDEMNLLREEIKELKQLLKDSTHRS